VFLSFLSEGSCALLLEGLMFRFLLELSCGGSALA